MPQANFILTDHGDLSSLSKDQHPLYVSISGSRNIVAVHDFNTGTTPFTVGATSSGVLTVGFNAEFLGGHRWSEISSGGGGDTLALSGYLVSRDAANSGYLQTYANNTFDTITNSQNISGYLVGKIIANSGYLTSRDNAISGFLLSKTSSTSGFYIPYASGGILLNSSMYIDFDNNTIAIDPFSPINTLTAIGLVTDNLSASTSEYINFADIYNLSGQDDDPVLMSPAPGIIYYNNQSGFIRYLDNSQWQTVATVSGLNTVSGYLNNKFSNYYTSTQDNAISGYLAGRIISISGYDSGQYNTISNTSSVSGFLYGRTDIVSGYLVSWSNANFGTITNDANISGFLYSRTDKVSGYLDGKFSNYYTVTQDNSISGYLQQKTLDVSGYLATLGSNSFDTISNASSVSGFLYGRINTVSGYLAGLGGGSPGGSSGYVQYNNGSNGFGGSSNFTFDGFRTKLNGRIETPIALIDSANIAIDASSGSFYKVTLGGNRTLNNPTNPLDGQIIRYIFKQDNSGSRTLSLDTKYSSGPFGTINLSTASGSVDLLSTIYDGTADKFRVVGFVPQSTSATTIISSAVQGTTTNDNAAAGYIGEVITSSVLSGSSISLSTTIAANITSISLSAGDWDVTGVVAFNPGATTVTTYLSGGISTTSATLGSLGSYFANPFAIATTTTDAAEPCPVTRISIAGTTTVYLIAKAAFSTSTLNGYGSIYARRVR